MVKRSASKGQDEGNHFLKGKLPVSGIVFAGSCGEEPFVVCHSLNCIFQCFFTVFGFISKPPRSLACRDTLLTTKAILLTEVSKMAARNDAFVKPCFELLRKKSSYPLISEGRRICQLNLLTLGNAGGSKKL